MLHILFMINMQIFPKANYHIHLIKKYYKCHFVTITIGSIFRRGVVLSSERALRPIRIKCICCSPCEVDSRAKRLTLDPSSLTAAGRLSLLGMGALPGEQVQTGWQVLPCPVLKLGAPSDTSMYQYCPKQITVGFNS